MPPMADTPSMTWPIWKSLQVTLQRQMPKDWKLPSQTQEYKPRNTNAFYTRFTQNQLCAKTCLKSQIWRCLNHFLPQCTPRHWERDENAPSSKVSKNNAPSPLQGMGTKPPTKHSIRKGIQLVDMKICLTGIEYGNSGHQSKWSLICQVPHH